MTFIVVVVAVTVVVVVLESMAVAAVALIFAIIDSVFVDITPTVDVVVVIAIIIATSYPVFSSLSHLSLAILYHLQGTSTGQSEARMRVFHSYIILLLNHSFHYCLTDFIYAC